MIEKTQREPLKRMINGKKVLQTKDNNRKVDESLRKRKREVRLKQVMNVEKIAYLLKREGKALSQTTVTKVIKELGLPLWVNRKKRKRPRYKSFERQKPN